MSLHQQSSRERTRWWVGDLALGVACLAPLLIARVVLLVELPTPLALADLRGVLADLAGAAVCWLALAALARVARPLALLLALAWVLVHYANLEHIDALGVMLDTANAHLMDSTFLRGSALAITRPLTLGLMLLVALVPAAASLYRLAGPRRLLLPLGVGLIAGAAALLSPAAGQVSIWRQGTPLLHQIAAIGRGQSKRTGVGGERSPELAALARVELKGARWLDSGDARQNVLLIVLESISGAMVDNVAAAHGLPSSGLMPRLSRISARHLSWSNFILQERMTSRGEYTLICGDHPQLGGGTTKMTTVAFGGARQCLPRLLARAGYQTVYAQAAPLSFMFKDRFMPRAGFRRVVGASHFDRGRAISQWGVDDVSFFEQVVPLVEQLDKRREPYFLTLLTVGTHHPYLIPDAFAASPAAKGLRRKHVAVRWADQGVGRFIDALSERGLLRDTLVLITSDESMGAPQALSSGLRQLSDNWGLLIALSPRARGPRVVESWGVASDVAVSILDYLGLTRDTGTLVGRSLFRAATPRTIIFGNVYRRQLRAIRADGTLHQCDHDFRRCQVFRVPSEGLFSRPLMALQAKPAEALLRGAVGLGSGLGSGLWAGYAARRAGGGKIPLVQREEVKLRGDGRVTMLTGGQLFKAAAGTRVRAILDFEIAGEGGAAVSSSVVLTDHAKPLGRFDLPLMSVGDRLRLNLVHVPSRDIGQLQFFFYAMVKLGEGATVRLRQATMDFAKQKPDGAAFAPMARPQLLLSPKRIRIKPTSTTFRLADPRHFKLFSCAKRGPAGVLVDASCAAGKPAIAGPDLSLYGRRELSAKASLRGRVGEAKIRIKILAQRGGEGVVIASETVEVAAGKQVALSAKGKLDGFSGKVRLQLHSEGSAKAKVLVERLELRASPPSQR